MSLIVAPSTSFEASLDVGTTGLVGTIAVGIYEGSTDTATSSLATTTINEIGTTGVYVATRTAPSTAGQYLVVWSLDGTLTPAQLATEDLLVTSAVSYAAPSGTAYGTSANIKATLSMSGETFADTDIAAALEAASRSIDGLCDRWFYQLAGTRYYTPDSSRLVVTDDIVTITSVATDTNGDSTFPTALALNTDYIGYPLNASADSKPLTRLTLHPRATSYFPLYPNGVKVVGTFGWPSVPAAVTEATTILTCALLKRSREAPFGVVTVGLDSGATMRIARNDPHVMFLLGPLTRLSV